MVSAIHQHESATSIHVSPPLEPASRLPLHRTCLVVTEHWLWFSMSYSEFPLAVYLTYDWVIFHCVYVPQLLHPFICQWTSQGCFHVLAIVNSASVNTGVHVSFSLMVSSGCMSSSSITGSYGSCSPGISILFSIVAVSLCIPTNSVRGFPFLHTLSSIYCL